MGKTVLEIIKNEFELRVIVESLARIEQCLGSLTLEQIWHKHNSNTNPIGNLILHLEGNIRQYIISGLGGVPDVRERAKEFVDGYSFSADELINKIRPTLAQANEVVQQLSIEQLSEEVTIQGFQHTRLSAIVHVVEHLSYHVGQITFYTKYVQDVDTAYYEGLDLDVVGQEGLLD